MCALTGAPDAHTISPPVHAQLWCCDSWCYVDPNTCTEKLQIEYDIEVLPSWLDVEGLAYSYAGACAWDPACLACLPRPRACVPVQVAPAPSVGVCGPVPTCRHLNSALHLNIGVGEGRYAPVARMAHLHRRRYAVDAQCAPCNPREPACEDDQSFPKAYLGAMYDKDNSGKKDRESHTRKRKEKQAYPSAYASRACKLTQTLAHFLAPMSTPACTLMNVRAGSGDAHLVCQIHGCDMSLQGLAQ